MEDKYLAEIFGSIAAVMAVSIYTTNDKNYKN